LFIENNVTELMTQLTILHTNDIHARVEQLLRAAYLAQVHRYELNAVGRHVILVDTGDVEDRSVIESDLSKGAALFRVLKAAGYDACAVGNGAALSYGPQVLESIAKASRLPLLCANLLTRDTPSVPVPGTQPTLIIPCDPIRLGLIGLTTSFDNMYERFFPVTMPDVIKTAQQHAAILRAQGCQVVGVVSHLGYEQEVELARAVPELNFVIGGHSHTLLKHPANINGIPVCQAGEYGQFVGRLDLTVEPDGRVSQWYGHLIPVPGEGPEHPAAAQMWTAIQQETQHRLSTPVGHLTDTVDLAPDRACGIGQLLADALRARLDTDISLCVPGHFHASLREGLITLGDLLRACSSPSNAGVAELTGSQIIQALEYGADPAIWQQTPHPLRGAPVGILQVSGLTYRLEPVAPAGKRVSEVCIGGSPIDPATVYRVAATDYELDPSRGYFPGLDLDTVKFDMPWVLREVLAEHLEKFNPLTPGLRPRISQPDSDTGNYIGPAVQSPPNPA
jgi:5'-nucleotidase